MTDIVDDFFQRLASHVPELPMDTRLKIEASLRQEWGGNRAYVAKRFSVAIRSDLLAGGLRQKLSLKDCFEQAGVSRRTGYRLLAKKA